MCSTCVCIICDCSKKVKKMSHFQNHSKCVLTKDKLKKSFSNFSKMDFNPSCPSTLSGAPYSYPPTPAGKYNAHPSQRRLPLPPLSSSRHQTERGTDDPINKNKDCMVMMSSALGGDDDDGPIPVQAGESRSIEIFFGKFTNFQTFYQALCDHGVSITTKTTSTGGVDEAEPEGHAQTHSHNEDMSSITTKVKPESIRKLVMVGHPMTSFSGMSRFTKLSEAWVTNCKIGEGKWCDFDGLKSLHKLYIYNCCLDKLEALHFPNLKILWVSGNNLQSLNFLGCGLPSLTELNAAKNEITCILEEQLFKCTSLQILNLSGNPLCTVQDVQAVKVLSNLQNLYLADPMYGKCPVAALCDGRTMLLSILTNISTLDGKSITSSELVIIQEYVKNRSLYYYSNSILAVANQVGQRKAIISTTHKNIESLGQRLIELLTLSSQYRRALDSVDMIPVFTNTKNVLRDHLVKMEVRVNTLRELATIAIKRIEMIMQISRWEQETEKWMTWIEFQSYGNTQCHIIQSVHGPRIEDAVQLCGCIHQLLSALACPNLWPQNTITKVETVIVLKDKGMEAGMERTFENYFAKKDEPVFIPPPPDTPTNSLEAHSTCVANTILGYTYPYYGLPVPPTKIIPTYTKPDFKISTPVHSFPDSVPGLPDRMQPLFMFLIPPSSNSTATNPLTSLHRIITEKSRYYKDIRVTNCLWIAMNQTQSVNNFCVVVVVKVLAESLQAIQCDKRSCAEDKQVQWHKGTPDDEDIIGPAKIALNNLTGKVNTYKFPSGTKRRSKKSPFIKKVCDGIHADLSAVQLHITKDGIVEPTDPLSIEYISPMHSTFDIQNVAKFLGLEATQFLTTLDLSGNMLGLTIGLEGLNSLKRLNLSHNHLTTLSGLHKLPNLIEFKVGWNYLRFLHSNVCTLAWTAPRLMTLEILPNPFQDIRNYAHIPILLQRTLPMLHRVDIWTSPFNSPSPLNQFLPPMVADAGFAHVAMAKSWVGTAHSYSELSNRCLTDLDLMPIFPPFPEGFGSNGMDLNLSNNYLNSHSLGCSPFVQSIEWRTSLVKLQLQENMIGTLDWMKEYNFPNVQILNLSNNHVTEVDVVPQSFPALRYLQLCGNPLSCDIVVLSPVRLLVNLNTLDCSASPLSSHPDYGGYVSKFLPNVQILDGIPITSWDLGESVERLGGILSQDWLEDKLGHRSFNTLTQLSFPNSNLQKIVLSSQSLTKLVSLDLQDNHLCTLTNLAALPNLRVLCVSHNNIGGLGSHPCPTCYFHTAESQAMNAQRMKRPNSKTGVRPDSMIMSQLQNRFMNMTNNDTRVGLLPRMEVNALSYQGGVGGGPRNQNNMKLMSSFKYSPPIPASMQIRKHKLLFPKLEVLIMAHNGLSALSDLHLHSMPTLQTVILNCNNLSTLQGLNDLPTVKALILDHNRIKDIPHNSLIGCNSLRYLHLEHNRISALPRLPHLTNLTSLYLSYNKIQCLTDLSGIAGTKITEMSLTGNTVSARTDYRINLKARIPQLTSLDGQDLSSEKNTLDELTETWFPGTVNIIQEYASHDPVFRSQKLEQDNNNKSIGQFQQESEFGLKVKSLSPHLATASPRALQFSSFKPLKRPDYI